MRLLMTTDAVGGVWRYGLDAARALETRGIVTTLAVIGPDPSPAQQTEAAGLHVVATGLPLEWAGANEAIVTRGAREIAALGEGYDVIQLNQPVFASLADWPAPVVAVVHGCVATWWNAVEGDTPLPDDLEWQAGLLRAGIACARATIAPTNAFAAALVRRHGLAAAPIAIHNGRAAHRAQAPTRADAIVGVGRLWDRGKNFALIDRIARQLPLPVELYGPLGGPNGERFEPAHVVAPGPVAADLVAERLATRPLFVAPSLYEPFGLAILEAAQAGCALVLADIATLRELWDGAAVFVDPRDDAAWVAALTGPLDRTELGDAARERAERYTIERMATRLTAVLERAA